MRSDSTPYKPLQRRPFLRYEILLPLHPNKEFFAKLFLQHDSLVTIRYRTRHNRSCCLFNSDPLTFRCSASQLVTLFVLENKRLSNSEHALHTHDDVLYGKLRNSGQ